MFLEEIDGADINTNFEVAVEHFDFIYREHNDILLLQLSTMRMRFGVKTSTDLLAWFYI